MYIPSVLREPPRVRIERLYDWMSRRALKQATNELARKSYYY